MQGHKVIISGGGTGGHVFPAIAIADALKRLIADIEILFVGARGKMEMEKVPAAGYRITGLWISGLHRRFTARNLLFPVKLIASLFRSRSILRSFRPDVVIGVGGYASGPVLFMASHSSIPVIIQEQNSWAGITNRLLGRRADKVCVAYEGMERFFPGHRIVLTGNPVRQDIAAGSAGPDDARRHFGLETGKKTLLVLGGSLGAATINASVAAALPLWCSNDIQVIWQCGRRYVEEAAAAAETYREKGVRTEAFIARMDLAYAAADLVVSRAGAGSVSELCLAGKAAILVPSPNVAEDHQTRNARSLTSKNAAVLVTDKEARDVLAEAVTRLMNDEARRNELAANISRMARPGAADAIARVAIELAEDRKKRRA